MKLKFNIKCKFCGNSEQDKFQTTMERDDGYSNWTVLDSGYIEIKCLKCGTFMSTDYEKENLGSNKKDMFEIICPICHSIDTYFCCGDVDNERDPTIICNKCRYEYVYHEVVFGDDEE